MLFRHTAFSIIIFLRRIQCVILIVWFNVKKALVFNVEMSKNFKDLLFFFKLINEYIAPNFFLFHHIRLYVPAESLRHNLIYYK